MRNVGLGLVVLFMVGCAAGGAAERAPASPESVGASAPAPAAAPAAEPAPGGMSDGSASGDAASAGPSTGAPPPPPPAPAAAPAVVAAKEASAPPAAIARPEPEPRRLPQSGQLTAGVWDDNRNFDFWKSYAAPFAQRGPDFALFSTGEMANAARAGAQAGQRRTELDVQLVLDTTGSMGDELAYLQGEFDAIAAQLGKKFPNVKPRWSLVVYRDKGDQYVTRHFDFTTDTAKFRRDLRAQSADGGGDMPEAVVEGLSAGLRESWRGGEGVAKVAFWVADAPTHPGEGRALAGLIREAKAKGVHLYPIASSDTDEVAEYQMRSAAQMTGGRYLFLTNDSGIGNDHAEPHIPCYNVTRLDHAIVRMLSVELGGRYIEAESNEVVRSVGRPDHDGKCRLSSGQPVVKF